VEGVDMNKPLLQELLKLSPAERIELIGELWDSIPPADLPALTPEQIEECERRLAEHRADPERAIPWEEAKSWIRSRLK
jgi:putative addiction module component (TIGR02574 family)